MFKSLFTNDSLRVVSKSKKTETMLVRLKDEGVNLVDPIFLKDYKLLSEALKSLILRHVHMKHPLQERVDRSITTKGEGKNLYAITIDYKKF